jgi:hypothetical protein
VKAAKELNVPTTQQTPQQMCSGMVSKVKRSTKKQVETFHDSCMSASKQEIVDMAEALDIDVTGKTKAQLCVELERELEGSENVACEQSPRKLIVKAAKELNVPTTRQTPQQMCVGISSVDINLLPWGQQQVARLNKEAFERQQKRAEIETRVTSATNVLTMSLTELRALAKLKNISGYSKLKKQELIDVLSSKIGKKAEDDVYERVKSLGFTPNDVWEDVSRKLTDGDFYSPSQLAKRRFRDVDMPQFWLALGEALDINIPLAPVLDLKFRKDTYAMIRTELLKRHRTSKKAAPKSALDIIQTVIPDKSVAEHIIKDVRSSVKDVSIGQIARDLELSSSTMSAEEAINLAEDIVIRDTAVKEIERAEEADLISPEIAAAAIESIEGSQRTVDIPQRVTRKQDIEVALTTSKDI